MLSYNRSHWTQTYECLQRFSLALFILIVTRNCLVVYCWKKTRIFHLSFFKLCTKWFAVWFCLAFVGRRWCMLLDFLASQFDVMRQNWLTFLPSDQTGKMSNCGPFTMDFNWLEKALCLFRGTQIYHQHLKCIPLISITEHEQLSAVEISSTYFHLNELMSLGEEVVEFFFFKCQLSGST